MSIFSQVYVHATKLLTCYFHLAGVPELLQRAFNNLGEILFGTDNKFLTKEAFFAKDELSLTNKLNDLVKRHPKVIFGSYPSWSNQYYKTKITLEAESEELLNAALTNLTIMDPIQYDKNTTENAYEKVQEFLNQCNDSELKQNVNESLKAVEEAFKRYEPASEKISVCFNGGKDCIAMLHIVYAVYQKKFPGKNLKSFYVKEKETFPEVEAYIEDACSRYNLTNTVLEGPMKPALIKMLAEDPSVEATVLGVRKGDPGSDKLDVFSPTDGDWPRVMRVNPILSWSYSNIWTFLRSLSLPYPNLYDNGYTSLGSPTNTVPNPALAYTTEKGEKRFKPAYELEKQELERQGRL